MVRIGLFWLGLAATYLAFVGDVTPAEAAAAAIAGVLGTLWVRQIALCGDRHLRFTPDTLRPLLTALARLPRETVTVARRLVRAAVHGNVGGEDRAVEPSAVFGCPLDGADPRSASACAVSVLAASLSPDSYVLRLDRERRRILLHGLVSRAAAAR